MAGQQRRVGVGEQKSAVILPVSSSKTREKWLASLSTALEGEGRGRAMGTLSENGVIHTVRECVPQRNHHRGHRKGGLK